MKQSPIKICNVYAVDFPSMIFRRLGKEGKIDFSQRSKQQIYPSSIKSTYALKRPAKPGGVLTRHKSTVNPLSKDNVKLLQQDWDSYETSWDFNKHPLI